MTHARVVATLVVGGLLASTASAQLVSNGNFTAGTGAPTTAFSQVGYGGSTASISNWSVAGNGVDWIGGYWQAPPGGGNSIDLSGSGAGSITQTLTGLLAGRQYRLQFSLAGNPDGGPAVVTGTAALGAVSQPFSFNTTGHSLASMGWTTTQLDFTAISASQTLTFSSTTASAFGPAIGNVSFAPVPEPATVGLLATAGLGLLRLARRRLG